MCHRRTSSAPRPRRRSAADRGGAARKPRQCSTQRRSATARLQVHATQRAEVRTGASAAPSTVRSRRASEMSSKSWVTEPWRAGGRHASAPLAAAAAQGGAAARGKAGASEARKTWAGRGQTKRQGDAFSGGAARCRPAAGHGRLACRRLSRNGARNALGVSRATQATVEPGARAKSRAAARACRRTSGRTWDSIVASRSCYRHCTALRHSRASHAFALASAECGLPPTNNGKNVGQAHNAVAGGAPRWRSLPMRRPTRHLRAAARAAWRHNRHASPLLQP